MSGGAVATGDLTCRFKYFEYNLSENTCHVVATYCVLLCIFTPKTSILDHKATALCDGYS